MRGLLLKPTSWRPAWQDLILQASKKESGGGRKEGAPREAPSTCRAAILLELEGLVSFSDRKVGLPPSRASGAIPTGGNHAVYLIWTWVLDAPHSLHVQVPKEGDSHRAKHYRCFLKAAAWGPSHTRAILLVPRGATGSGHHRKRAGREGSSSWLHSQIHCTKNSHGFCFWLWQGISLGRVP